MNMVHRFTAMAVAALITTPLAIQSPSSARSIVQPGALDGNLNVSVSFNIQMPLADLDEATIVAGQRQGRALIYRLAGNECDVLLEEIADTCRLVGLNASTNIPQPHSRNPLYINLSGSAQFAIGLKTGIAE